MHPWWWRSMAACTSVAVVAGLVGVVATAADGDRAQRDRATLTAARAEAATEPTPATASPVAEAAPDTAAAPTAPTGPTAPVGPTGPTGPTAPARTSDRVSGASVEVPPGWRPVRSQRIVPVVPGRFGTVIAAGGRAVVLVGPLDRARARIPATGPALEAEARRLVAAFGDGAAPSATRLVAVRDDDQGIAGRAAWTSLRRADGGDRRTAGTLVRVSTVDAAPGAPVGVVLLAVVLPGPTQAADARTAEQVVRSLEPVRPRSEGPSRPAEPRPAPPRPPRPTGR